MRRKPIIAGLVIIVIVAIVVGVVLGVGGGGDDDDTTVGSGENQVTVPINLEGASNVGSISIELAYDSTVLEATDIEAGALASNAMMEYNISTPGQVIIGIIDSSGINGEGVVAEIGFNVIDSDGTSSLTLDTAETHDATSLIDIINEPSDGSFVAEGNTVSAPVVRFGE